MRPTTLGFLGLLLVVSAGCALVPANQDGDVGQTSNSNRQLDSWQSKHSEDEPIGPDSSLEWNIRTVGALVIICATALLANSAGIGGGPIILPTLLVILGLELTPATALSHTIVSVSAIGSSIYGVISRSPNAPDRSLIDWDLAIFIPALLVGVSVGVLFNVIFPRWVQTVMLTILLIIVFVKTLGKGKKMWQSERKDADLKKRHAEDANHVPDQDTDDEEEGVLHEESYHLKPHKLTRQSMSLGQDEISRNDVRGEQGLLGRVSEVAAHDAKLAKKGIRGCLGRQPYFKIVSVVVLWVIFLIFQQSKSKYTRCTGAYIGLFIGEVVLFSLFAILGVYLIARQAQNHPEDVDPELRDALLNSNAGGSSSKKTMPRLLLVSAVMAVSGLLAGLLGIGGALIFNPFLLALGIHPQVTASTSVLLILFSSSAICISLAFQGFLNASYALLFAPCAFVASILGVTLIGKVIKRTGHVSIIVFILTGLIGIGCLLTAVFGGIRNAKEIKSGGGIGFKPFCQ